MYRARRHRARNGGDSGDAETATAAGTRGEPDPAQPQIEVIDGGRARLIPGADVGRSSACVVPAEASPSE